MWSDRESSQDFLNFTEVAEQIATLASNPNMLPISIGVFGTWGTGKSTVLKLVGATIGAAERPPLVIEFDAWLYQGFDDAKAALMEVVAESLLTAAKDDQTLVNKVTAFASRVNYFRAIGMAADFGVGMAFGVPPGLLTRAGSAISALVAGDANPPDTGAIKEAAKDASNAWSKLVKPEKERTPPKEIAAFRKEFGEILVDLDRTLVLFIDNLDRCLPDVAISTLEAVRLFLFMPGTAFIIAADEDMIRHSVAKHFRDPNASHVRDYLDKVIQVPFRVPRVGVDDVRAYMYSLFVQQMAPGRLDAVQSSLLEVLQNAWQGRSFNADDIDELAGRPTGLLEMLGTADRLAPILIAAPNIDGNPRIIKRLLNAVILRRDLAAARGMNVDLATLAKLAIFERGTDTDASRALFTIVMEGGDDARRILVSTRDLGGETRPPAPLAWQAHDKFIEQWRELEPRFGDPVSLQPALFLSRDVMAPSRGRRTSDRTAAAIDALMAVASPNSPTANQVCEGLTEEERSAVMAGLVSRMREADWSSKVAGLPGALILGDKSEAARRQLQALVSDLPTKNMNKGVQYALRRSRYLSES
jgi:predicted KAP-like P-loop ATPase